MQSYYKERLQQYVALQKQQPQKSNTAQQMRGGSILKCDEQAPNLPCSMTYEVTRQLLG